jgi:hypothetical protein
VLCDAFLEICLGYEPSCELDHFRIRVHPADVKSPLVEFLGEDPTSCAHIQHTLRRVQLFQGKINSPLTLEQLQPRRIAQKFNISLETPLVHCFVLLPVFLFAFFSSEIVTCF